MGDLPRATASLEVVWVCPECLYTNVQSNEPVDDDTVREAVGLQPWELVPEGYVSTAPTDTCKCCGTEFRIEMTGEEPSDEQS